MDTQTAYPRGYNQEHDPNIIGHEHGEAEHENHHEKKSVLKKVKAKAKKIKDTITKHGYGHNHDHDDHGHQYPEGHIPDDHDLDEEDDEEEEIVDDPEVHGAPMYESAAARSALSGQPEDLNHPGITYNRSNALHPDPIAPRDSSGTFYSGNDKTKYNNDQVTSSVPGVESLVVEKPRINTGKTNVIAEEPLAPQNTPVPCPSHRSKDADPPKTFVHGQEEYPGQPKVNLQRPKGVEEDPAAPEDTRDAYTTSNYENKVTDPTGKAGGEVTGITPTLHSLDKMKIHDEQDTGREQNFPAETHRHSELSFPTGSHDQVTSSVPGLESLAAEKPRINSGKTNVIAEEPLEPQNTPVPRPSHQSKDADPAKTFVHEQEEYPGQPKVNLQRPKGLEDDPAAPEDTRDSYTTTNYQTKVTDPAGKAGGEATGITPILHSLDKMKIHDEQDTGREQNFPVETHRPSEASFPTGSHDQFSPEPTPAVPINTPEKSPISENMETTKREEHPHHIASDKPENQRSYTEKISSATSAIADKAASAKNVVASKLGYGEKDQTPASESHEGQGSTKRASAVDYGKQMAAAVTEKLTPVYEKVAGAGSNVLSKKHGPGTGTASEVETEVQEQDKGVSMKGYIAEKLRPGEEDKVLSGVITDALHKRKEDPEKETRPRGKVTESVEVQRRLGTGDERDERAGPGSVNSPTKGVVDKLKGAVGSWFGKGEESTGIQQEHGSSPGSYGNEGFTSSTGERRLQESSN